MGREIRNIVFCIASRADKGIVKPLLKRLKAHPDIHLEILELIPYDFIEAVKITEDFILDFDDIIHLAFTPFDRVEMFGAASQFTLAHVLVAQLHAGDLSVEGAFDDILRHCVTLLSTFQFCNGSNSFQRATKLLNLIGKHTQHCHEVGSIHFDDIKIDYSQVPNEPFDLVLYNPPTRALHRLEDELDSIERCFTDRLTLWIDPNEDEGSTTIFDRMDQVAGKRLNVELRGTLPRSHFLGLLSHAIRIIGNSSSFFIELPYFEKFHMHIGVRNSRRERMEPNPGGSDRIMKILEEWLWRF